MEEIGISNIYAHPDYSSLTLANDFALVRLASSSQAQPVDMDESSLSPSYVDGTYSICLDLIAYCLSFIV